MEILIVIAAIIGVIVLLAKSSSIPPPSTGQFNQCTAEQLRDRKYKITRQLAKLSTESSNIISNLRATDADMRRHQKIKDQMAALDEEEILINSELSRINGAAKKPAETINNLINNHVKLVMLLIKEKGFTEEQANTAILNKIESRQREYQLKGLSEEQALEKAGHDVYRLADKKSES